MNLYLGVTDTNWFNYLRTINPEDVNFWQPGGSSSFRVLEPGAPFLFKLKSPINAIGGVGFFVSHSLLPLTMAWNFFGNRNGCETYTELKHMIQKYRKDEKDINPVIGCIVLTDPVFFNTEDFIPVPDTFHQNIMKGKSYSMDDAEGRSIWAAIETRLPKYRNVDIADIKEKNLWLNDDPQASKYGAEFLTRSRLGQGAFRILVSDTYQRRCAITGEKTFPVLEAAHIKPYAESGPHAVKNGLLLRSDLHKLFDAGYITVTDEYRVEVSGRIRDEFENGREYYRFHGEGLIVLPEHEHRKPGRGYIEWHNENIYRG